MARKPLDAVSVNSEVQTGNRCRSCNLRMHTATFLPVLALCLLATSKHRTTRRFRRFSGMQQLMG
jgi:hypothetical protein